MSSGPNDDDNFDYATIKDTEDFEMVEYTLSVNPHPNLPCHALTKKYIIIPTQADLEKVSTIDKESINTKKYNGDEVVFESPIQLNHNGTAFRTLIYYATHKNDFTTLQRTRIDKVSDNSVEATLYASENPKQVASTFNYRINKNGELEG
jgi:hypothetical protein